MINQHIFVTIRGDRITCFPSCHPTSGRLGEGAYPHLGEVGDQWKPCVGFTEVCHSLSGKRGG